MSAGSATILHRPIRCRRRKRDRQTSGRSRHPSAAPVCRAIVEKLVKTGDLSRLDRLATARRVITDERPLQGLKPGGSQGRTRPHIPADAQLRVEHSKIECFDLVDAFSEPIESSAQGEPQSSDRSQIFVEPGALVVSLKRYRGSRAER